MQGVGLGQDQLTPLQALTARAVYLLIKDVPKRSRLGAQWLLELTNWDEL